MTAKLSTRFESLFLPERHKFLEYYDFDISDKKIEN